MITKLRKAQDSWLAKVIFLLTAVSFMSLFGISGYLNHAASNPAVISVNDRNISLAEFNAQIDEQIKMARKLFGDNLEITDEMRNTIASELVQKNLTEQIIKELAGKNRIYVSNKLIGVIIANLPQFRDEKGKFSPARFHNFLQASEWSEQKYVETLRNDLVKSILISNPVSNIKAAKVLLDLTGKAESQRRVFKYIELVADNIKVDREISEEEIEQYYSDFGSEFMEPEKRDITVLELSFDDIAAKIEISEDEIKEFYNENIDRFVVPEKREVLQMLFADENSAKEAVKKLAAGADFYDTASELADQTREETSLGVVDKDMLIADIAEDVFVAKKGVVIGPINSELGWHVLKVIKIEAGSKTDDNVARKQIIEALRIEKSYENADEVIKDIDDKIGSGTTLEEIAEQTGRKLITVKGLTDLDNSPYIEAAFSYNADEISQATETDNGYAFVRIDNIVDARPRSVEEAMPQIKEMWLESEKAAVLNEIVGDVMNDLENGNDIAEIAGRYNLKLVTTEALVRSQNFGGLSQAQMGEMFNEDLNYGKQFNLNGKTIIAVASADVAPRELSDEDNDILQRRLRLDISNQAASQLINSYGKDYDVRVKYRQLGLED